jgi:putative methionine-R-sulfoxide reductase with GAF domain
MTRLLSGLLSPPLSKYTREDDISAVRLLNATLLIVGILAPIVTISLSILQGNGLFSLSSSIGLFVAALMVGMRILLERGYLQMVSWMTTMTLQMTITGTLFLFNGVRDSSAMALVVVIVIASLLLRNRRSIALVTGLTVLGILAVYVGELVGIVQYEPLPLDVSFALGYVISFILVGILLDIAITNLNQALARARASEQDLAQVNSELETLNQDLEARVAARTRALELSADISRRLSTILDQEELVHTVVEQVQRAFNYYHVHIYLLDAHGENLRMVGGSGDAGRIMLARGHTIPWGHGLVGRAAETALPVVIPDVSREPGWLPNQLLPETRSEIAVPIVRRGQVLGVLDVQHNVERGLGQEDAELLQTISNQVAVALQNARLFQQTQRQAQREMLLASIAERIYDTPDMDSALKVTVRELGRALNKNQTGVRLNIAERKPL